MMTLAKLFNLDRFDVRETITDVIVSLQKRGIIRLYAKYQIKENHSLRSYTSAKVLENIQQNALHNTRENGGQEEEALPR